MKAVVNAKVVLPERVLKDAVIFAEGETIVKIGKNCPVPEDAEVIDAGGMYVGPGFVDIHVHGDGKTKYWEDDPVSVAKHHLRHGSTSMCAFFGYGHTPETLYPAVENCQKELEAGNLPNVLGIGFEGPYISPRQGAGLEKRGFGKPKKEEFEHLYKLCRGNVVQWMYAPEIDEDGTFAAFLREKGIVTAIGHTEASPDMIRKAVDRGAVNTTHLFDAMGCHLGDESVNATGTIQDSAAVGCLICPELSYELIPDQYGVHVKPANLRLVYQFAGPERISLITDSTGRDYNPADYGPDSLRSDIDINYAKTDLNPLPGGFEISGSCMTMDRVFKNFAKHTGAPITDLFRMTSTTPARVIRRDGMIGSLVEGKYANLVFIDENLDLRKVIFRGEEVK